MILDGNDVFYHIEPCSANKILIENKIKVFFYSINLDISNDVI